MSVAGVSLGIGYILMSMVHAPWQLYLFYGLFVGVGMVGGFVPLMSTIARWFDRKRGLMTGVISAAIGVGAVTGPPLANGLIEAFGWRMSYVILGTAAMAVIVIAAQFLKRDPADFGQHADGSNRCIASGSCCEPVKGLSRDQALRTASFWLYFAMIICFGFCVFSVMVHTAAHAAEMGLSPGRAAKILATIGGFSIAGKLIMGKLTDIFGSRAVFLAGFILMSTALLWLIGARTAWALYLFAALFGIAYGGGVTAESPLVAFLFGLKAHGALLGLISFGFSLGGALGPWITGHIFDVSGNYRTAFIVCSILSVTGLFLTVLLGYRRTAGRSRLPADSAVDVG
jgi:MFS family permease